MRRAGLRPPQSRLSSKYKVSFSEPSDHANCSHPASVCLEPSETTSFNLDVVHKQTAEFIERCLNNPTEKAVDVMSKLKSEWK